MMAQAVRQVSSPNCMLRSAYCGRSHERVAVAIPSCSTPAHQQKRRQGTTDHHPVVLTTCRTMESADAAAAHQQPAPPSLTCGRPSVSWPTPPPAVTRALLCGAMLMCTMALLPAPLWAASSGAAGSSSPFAWLVDLVMHLDKHLGNIIAEQGRGRAYALLAAIVFCETGLVVTPFLPGDSLLFAAGSLAALGHLGLLPLMGTFITAAILGDAVNYAAGQFFGRKALQSKVVNPSYVEKTERFYAKHGGKTVVLARFVPIVRTFAPFVAGVGQMDYSTFAAYNVGGAILWAVLFVGAGYMFGNLPFVQHNFAAVVGAIVAVSVLPIVYEVWAARKEEYRAKGQGDLEPLQTQPPDALCG